MRGCRVNEVAGATAARRIHAASVTAFAAQWEALGSATERRALEERFLAAFPTNPVLGDTRRDKSEDRTDATFIWRAPADSPPPARVQLHLNALTGERGGCVDAGDLERVSDSSLWAASYELPAALTASYRIEVTAAAAGYPPDEDPGPGAVPDPRNPRILPAPRGDRTALFGGPSAWEHPVWLPGTRRRSSTMERITVPSLEGVSRVIHLYRPTAAAPPQRLLVLFDGEQWVDLGIQTALDRWRGGELAVALVSSGSAAQRSHELPYPARAARLVREEVLPAVFTALGHAYAPADIIVAGQSYGGLASVAIVAEHPEIAALAIAQSPSFHFVEGEPPRPPAGQRGSLSQRLPNSGSRSRIIVTAGTLEGGLLDQVRIAVNEISETRMRVEYREFAGGHDYAWWRHGLFWALDTLERAS